MDRDFVQQRLDNAAEAVIFLGADAGDAPWEAVFRGIGEIEEAAGDDRTAAEAARLLVRALRLVRGGHDLETVIDALSSLVRGDVADRAAAREVLAESRARIEGLEGCRAEAEAAVRGIDPEFAAELAKRIDGIETMVMAQKPGATLSDARELMREFHTLKGEAGILNLQALHRFSHAIESLLEPYRARPLQWRDAHTAAFLSIVDGCRRLSEGTNVDAAALTESLRAGLEDEADLACDTPAGAPPGERECAESETTRTDSIHVKSAHLDDIASLAGEIVLAGELVRDKLQADGRSGAEVAQALQRLTSNARDLQDSVATLQMTHVGSVAARLRRAALDAAFRCGKPVEFSLEGGDTAIDRRVLDTLWPGLVHAVRNGVDHGIEAPDVRAQAGKPERGAIVVRARREGTTVLLQVADDGRGIDHEGIRAEAARRGLIAPDATPTHEELEELIFTRGLSTASRVTAISGRGVGLDVFKRAATAAGGDVSVASTPGQGTTFSLRVPLSCAAIEGLVVVAGGEELIVPLSAVKETRRLAPQELGTVYGTDEVVTIRGTVLPLVRMGAKFAAARERGAEDILVIVEDARARAALAVDAVSRTRRVVVRPLPAGMAYAPFVAGVAALSDGRLVVVVDPHALVPRDAGANARRAQEGAASLREGRIETIAIGGNRVGMMDFWIAWRTDGGEERARFAINAFKARECVVCGELTPLPGAPEGFAGMARVRDALVPVVDLGGVLGLGDAATRRQRLVMVCEFGRRTVGFLVSGVSRVNYVTWEDIQPPPREVACAHAVGTIFLDGEIVFVLDFERILASVLPAPTDEFTLRLPQRGDEAARVLLVDDSPLVRRRVKEALTGAGVEVLEAANGEEGLAVVRALAAEAGREGRTLSHRLDLVLTDIEMPRMDGYTLTLAVKQDPALRAVPVVLHSSITNDTMVRRAREVHADGFVAKADPAELVAELGRFL